MISEEQLFLKPKRFFEESLRFRIPITLIKKGIFGDNYCTWEELLKIEGPLPTDFIRGISWDEELEEDIAVLVVSRNREETDEEYLERLDSEAEFTKSAQDYEKREYQRLKAKYENLTDIQIEEEANKRYFGESFDAVRIDAFIDGVNFGMGKEY